MPMDASGNSSIGMFDSEHCVWSGPEWLESKQRLRGISRFGEREHLFRKILGIRNANWKDYVEDLKLMKDENCGTTERAFAIYKDLWRDFDRSTDWDILR